MAIVMSFPSGGHHNSDPGAVANGYSEFELMSMFRNKVTAYLEKKGHRYITDKDWETNSQYQNRIKPREGDFLIDFHADAASNKLVSGVGTFVSNNAGVVSKRAAKEIVDGLAKIMGIPNRGVKDESQTARKRIGILNKPGAAVLVELFFITNPNDIKAFLDNLECIVEFIGQMIIKYDTNK